MHVTHNTKHIEWNNTCLQGEIKATYKELCDLFGNPTIFHGGEGKMDAHWAIDFGGTVATIYNWKNGPNYCGFGGIPVEHITDWHVGGHKRDAFDSVQIALDLYREKKAEPHNPAEEVMQSLDDMLACLRAQKGEKFADAVWFAAHVRKMMDLFGIVLHASSIGRAPTGKSADLIGNAFAELSAAMLHAHCDALGIEEQSEALEITQWADRFSETEKRGVNAVIKSMNGGGAA